jgi:Protein of unknown function (DUF1018)
MNIVLATRHSDRKNLLSKVHIAKKQLGLDDDTYRASLSRITGKSSARDMSEGELEAVLKDFSKRGFKPVRKGFTGPAAASQNKIMALWLSGWNLGVIANPSAQAMETFILRQTKITKAQWLKDAGDAGKVIDGLKAWLAREAKVDWATAKREGKAHYMDWPQYRVCVAQWQALIACGGVEKWHTWTGHPQSAQEEVLRYAMIVCAKNLIDMTKVDFTHLQAALGKKLRKALEGK